MPTTTINLTGQALSKVDDTNVTLTLGGTPLTALLKATSLTLGWTGTLADARITSAATWNAKESALTFSTGLTRTVNTITIDNTVVTLTGAQALSNKTGLISQWTNDSGFLTSLAGAVTSVSGTASRISSTGGATPVIDIDAAYVGQTSITTLGTIGTGTWNAGQITATKAFTDPVIGKGIESVSTFANSTNNNGTYVAGIFSAEKTDNNSEAGGALGGISSTAYISGNGTLDSLAGITSTTDYGGNGTQLVATGIQVEVLNSGAGAITDAYAFKVANVQGTNKYGFFNNVAGVTNSFLSLNLGTASSVAGQLILHNATNAFTQTIRGTNPVASITYDLPTTAPTSGQVLSATAPAAGIATLSWATASSGITINSTAITGGGANRLLFENSSNQVSETATDFYFTTSTPFTHVFASGRTGVITGVGNSLYGYQSGKVLTTGVFNFFGGYNSGLATLNGSENVGIGAASLGANVSGSGSVAIGHQALNALLAGGGTAVGYNAALATTGTQTCAFGYSSLATNSAGAFCSSFGYEALLNSNADQNSAFGQKALRANTSGTFCSAFGSLAGLTNTTGSYNTYLGTQADNLTATGISSSIAIGTNAKVTASNQCVIGAAAAASGIGVVNNLYFNGVTHTSAAPIVINSCGGSGTNNAGASFTIAGGKGTGTGAGGNIVFQTSTTLGGGTTLQTLATRLTISGGAVTTGASTATWADALDFVFGSTTGTKIGTATTQKIGFWNATPIVQLTTAVGSATFASPGGGTSIKTDDTFDGYTLQQVVKALRNLGILA